MRKLKVLGLCILALFAIAALGAVALSIYGSYALKAQIAAVREKGYPATPEEFDADIVPDEDNAALIYERIFESEDKEFREQLEDVMYRISESRAGGTPEQWAEARNIVTKCEPTVALLEKAVAKSRCRLPRDWSLAGLVPSRNACMRRLAQFCGYRAKVSLRHGDMEQAVHSVELGLKICLAFDEEPGFVGYLVRSAVAAIAGAGMRDLVKTGDVSQQQARRLYDTLAEIDVDESFRQAIIGELVMTVSQAQETAAECRHARAPYEYSPRAIGEQVGYILYGYTAIWADTAINLGNLLEATEAVGLSYKEMKDRGMLDREAHVPFYAMISKMSIPTAWRAHRMRFRDAFRLNMGRITLAIAAYKDIHGEYPESLDQLKSSLGWELPKDPYSGQDFGYRREGTGYILYSTGPDGEDDGGVQRSPVQLDDEETGDWVWEMKD